MFLVAAPVAWSWVTNISTSLLIVWGLTPEKDPYEDIGIVAIGLVFVFLVYQAIKLGRKFYATMKIMKEV